MRSLKEQSEILHELNKKKGSMLSILSDSGKDYLNTILNNCIKDVYTELSETRTKVDTFSAVCNSDEFIKSMSENKGVLSFISQYTKTDVKPEDIQSLVTFAKQPDVVDSPIDTRKESQVSSSEFAKLLGLPSFNLSAYSPTVKSSRTRTKSEPFSTKYVKFLDTYVLRYKSETEVCNVFTLYDYLSGKKYKHKEDGMESIVTLSANMFSLLGFPKSNGVICDSREETDYVCTEYNKKFPRYNFNSSGCTTYFAYNGNMLRSFMSALGDLGYSDILFRYFSDAILAAKEYIEEDIFLKHIYFSESSGRDDRTVIKSGKKGYLCYSANDRVSRADMYELMYMAVCCIAQVHSNFTVEDLTKLVKFYGGHDFENQGDDLNNFFNTDIEYSYLKDPIKTTKPLKETKSNNRDKADKKEEKNQSQQELTDGFIPYLDCINIVSTKVRPAKMRFRYKGDEVVITPNVLVRSSKRNYLASTDILYSVIQYLSQVHGVSLEEMCDGSGLLDVSYRSTTPCRTLSQAVLSDGSYYYVNKCIGWSGVWSALKHLFARLDINSSSLELSF